MLIELDQTVEHVGIATAKPASNLGVFAAVTVHDLSGYVHSTLSTNAGEQKTHRVRKIIMGRTTDLRKRNRFLGRFLRDGVMGSYFA